LSRAFIRITTINADTVYKRRENTIVLERNAFLPCGIVYI
jgi:hypothetical protein